MKIKVGPSGKDDHPHLRAAIEKVGAAGGGEVHLAAGSYTLHKSNLKFGFKGKPVANVAIIGAGPNLTSIKLAAGVGACIYDATSGHKNIRISGITFDAGHFSRTDCIALGTPLGLTIEDCVFRGTLDHRGVAIGNISDYLTGLRGHAVVRNCRFENLSSGTYQVLWFGNCPNSLVDHCIFTNNLAHAGCIMLFGYCDGFQILDCEFFDNQGEADILIGLSANVLAARNVHRSKYANSAAYLIENSTDVEIRQPVLYGIGRGVYTHDWAVGEASFGKPPSILHTERVTVRDPQILGPVQKPIFFEGANVIY